MGLFIKKPLGALQAEANESGSKTLKRVLGPWSLVALGVGVIIGAGLFSITGTVAAGIYRSSHYLIICHCCVRLLLCRIMLCRICIHDTGCRKCLHLFICHDGGTDCLDYRLGFGT